MAEENNARPDGRSGAEGSTPERMQCMEVWGGNRETDTAFEMPGLKTWVYSRPHEDAKRGGDVYYLSSCASGRITRILLADVMGHGSLAAETARVLRDLMRQNVNLIQQKRFVREMNQQFSAVADHGGFATALVGTFFAPRQSLAICNAGHPFPLVYRAAKSEWSMLQRPPSAGATPTDMPLGIMKDTDYLITETQLDANDLLLGYSDALTESRNREGKLLGGEGILGIIRQLDASRPEDLIPRLLEAVVCEAPENVSHDDVTVVLVQATGTRSTIKDTLLAPFRLLGKVTDRTEWT